MRFVPATASSAWLTFLSIDKEEGEFHALNSVSSKTDTHGRENLIKTKQGRSAVGLGLSTAQKTTMMRWNQTQRCRSDVPRGRTDADSAVGFGSHSKLVGSLAIVQKEVGVVLTRLENGCI